MITTTNEVYEFTRLAIQSCRELGYDSVAQQLDDAMNLGSSGLEILGAIKSVFVAHAATFDEVVDGEKREEVIEYVSRTYGE